MDQREKLGSRASLDSKVGAHCDLKNWSGARPVMYSNKCVYTVTHVLEYVNLSPDLHYSKSECVCCLMVPLDHRLTV